MRSAAICSLLVLLGLPAAGLEPYLVKDIDPVQRPASSEPYFPVTFGKAVLFSADDGLSGRQLWRSDGTAAGTWPLSDAAPGDLGYSEPFQVTERLYFFRSVDSFRTPASLWVSDGTPAGTFRLTGPGVDILDPPPLWMAGQGVLYFVARDAEHGDEPWRSDGTPAGTYRIADVRPGPEGSGVRGMVRYRGRVWFGADDGQRGGSLWSTDGSLSANGTGTVLAVDPFPGSSSHGVPELVSAVGDRLAFFAPPVGGGPRRRLWAGDGSRRGTVPLQEFSGGEGRGVPDAVVQGNRLYFVAETRQGQELWVSDGTADGTRALTAFMLREAFGFFNSPDDFRYLPRQPGISGGFVFLADDGVHGVEPWITDGTPHGTRLIQDVCRGICPSDPDLGPVLAGRLWFSAVDRDSGRELWSTDGTRTRLRDICPGECSSSPEKIYVVGGRLLFAALDPQQLGELWTSDGTAAGTVRIGDFATDDIWYYGLVGAALDGRFLFSFDDGEHGDELWIADLTPGGFQLVEDINRTDAGGSYARFMVPFGNQVLFSVPNTGPNLVADLWKSDGTEAGTVRFAESVSELGSSTAEVGGVLFYLENGSPWRTDGTAEGTFRLMTEQPAYCCPNQQAIRAVGSTVFFNVLGGEYHDELWASDGTVAGTRLVRDILPDVPWGSEPEGLTAFQGRLWFSAQGPGTGRELWTSDGTAAGTVLVADIKPGGDYDWSSPELLTVHAGRLWFFADDGEHGRELWSSDGTAAGTRLEVDLVPGPGSFAASFLAPLGDRLVFSAYGQGLWVSDGTPAGTRKIHDREADLHSVILAEFQGRLFYVAEGTTLWVTDGTEAGTGPFLDRDGRSIFYPWRFAVLGDRLVFTAWDVFSGTLFESDGTPAGTFPIEPRISSSVYDLAVAGDRIFFSGWDPATGWELWAVRP
jgi:ELWxxDGT repeat protein